MIPQLVSIDGIPWQVLPPGIHTASLDDVKSRYAIDIALDPLLLTRETP